MKATLTEASNTSAKEGRDLGWVHILRNCSQRLNFERCIFSVSAIDIHACTSATNDVSICCTDWNRIWKPTIYRLVLTCHEITRTAAPALTALTAMPPGSDSLTDVVAIYSWTERHDFADNLVSRDTGQSPGKYLVLNTFITIKGTLA